jgi:hypothetical protein
MKMVQLCVVGAAAALLALQAVPGSATERPNIRRGAGSAAGSRASAVQAGAGAVNAPGLVTSREAVSGRATFIWSVGPDRRARAGASPEAAARHYLEQHAAHYGAGARELDTVVLRRIHDTGRGGILAIFGQRVEGIDLEGVRVTVLMKRNLDLVALGGSLMPTNVSGKGPGGADQAFIRGPEDALDVAFRDLFGLDSSGSWRADGERNGASVWKLLPSAEIATGVTLWGPSRVWQVWHPAADGLVAAHKLEILANDADGDVSYSYVINARDGEILQRTNLTDDVHQYRAWSGADPLTTPLDGPISDVTPHPTGLPDGTAPSFIAPTLALLGEFNATLDPWLANGAVQTLGNNIDAYADLFAPDGYSNGDLRAVTTGAGIFDHSYDTLLAAGANSTQTYAAVAHLFYVTNWLHDFYYDSGFDEAAGNAQTNNFGRGGAGGDEMRAESDDFGGTNNANMSTPADGLSPRMQMYPWNGPGSRFVRRLIPLPEVEFPHGTAASGVIEYDVTANLALYVDATPPINDGCEVATNAGELAGKIALIDRGLCAFAVKAANAFAAGAVGAIIANVVPLQATTNMSGTFPIASVNITKENGDILKADLAGGPVSMRLFRHSDPLRSGSLDTMIVAHEWGHYFHHRLQDCGSDQCRAQSEGWGDFVALHTAIEDGDNYDGGVYGPGIYTTAQFGPDAAYFGIRRFPYSTDFTRNGLTFRHIALGEPLPATPISPAGWQNNGNSEVHNAGEIWASMLLEAYVALLTDTPPAPFAAPEGGPRLTFDEARRRMADYMAAGLQMTPVDSTFTETRDGILAAAFAADELDYLAMVQAFATRGAGSCAASPPRFSSDFVGVDEDFTLGARMAATEATFDDDVLSCDNDGYLDSLETGTVRLSVSSLGPEPLEGTEISLSSDNPHVTFPSGNTVILGTLDFGETANVAIPVAADGTTIQISSVTITVTVSDPETCEVEIVSTRTLDLAVNEQPSSFDNVEPVSTTWTESGDAGLWTRVDDAGNRVWHGADSGFVTDTRLESAPIQINGTGNVVLEFDHRYSFEYDATHWWDGGVIEYTADGGSSWTDLSELVVMPYDGVITNISGNPLADRNAFSGQNPSYPAMDHLALDLGGPLAGQTVQFRFRIGTDSGTGAEGWDIDNIHVTNASNQPFIGFTGDSAVCSADELFVDGFESGDSTAWSSVAP